MHREGGLTVCAIDLITIGFSADAEERVEGCVRALVSDDIVAKLEDFVV
jgi:hypothetical protein